MMLFWQDQWARRCMNLNDVMKCLEGNQGYDLGGRIQNIAKHPSKVWKYM